MARRQMGHARVPAGRHIQGCHDGRHGKPEPHGDFPFEWLLTRPPCGTYIVFIDGGAAFWALAAVVFFCLLAVTPAGLVQLGGGGRILR